MCTYVGSVVTLVSVCLYGVFTLGTPFYFMLSWPASYVFRAPDCRYPRLQEFFFSFPQFPVCSKNVYRQCYIVNMVRTRKTGLFPL
uniref:Putative secreted protein n=1 Tax=Ixodes scapularis TaxID=6945 RepID=A0A4D5RCI7_IXOSC